MTVKSVLCEIVHMNNQEGENTFLGGNVAMRE